VRAGVETSARGDQDGLTKKSVSLFQKRSADVKIEPRVKSRARISPLSEVEKNLLRAISVLEFLPERESRELYEALEAHNRVYSQKRCALTVPMILNKIMEVVT